MLALAIAIAFATPPHSFPVDLLRQEGWTIVNTEVDVSPTLPRLRSNLRARKSIESALYSLRLEVLQPREGEWSAIRHIGIWNSGAPLKGNPPLSSGIPAGLEHEVYPNSAGRIDFGILGNSIYVGASALAVYWEPNSGDAEPAELAIESKLFCERLARLTLAGFVGENLTAEGIGSVAGRATAAARSPKTKEAFAILSEWVKPTEWKVSESEDGHSLILTRGQDTLKAPIGAFGMFVNGEWKPATDTIALRDGQWWAPESALKIIAELA